MCSAQYGCFCSALISRFPGTLFRYCLSNFEIIIIIIIIIIIPCIKYADSSFWKEEYWRNVTLGSSLLKKTLEKGPGHMPQMHCIL
jgi:hypothetical protein